MSDHGTFAGLFFVRCANCPSATLDPNRYGWRFFPDGSGRVLGLCSPCARAESGGAASPTQLVALCPSCDDELEPQPRGGWYCRADGLVVAPKLRFEPLADVD